MEHRSRKEPRLHLAPWLSSYWSMIPVRVVSTRNHPLLGYEHELEANALRGVPRSGSGSARVVEHRGGDLAHRQAAPGVNFTPSPRSRSNSTWTSSTRRRRPEFRRVPTLSCTASPPDGRGSSSSSVPSRASDETTVSQLASPSGTSLLLHEAQPPRCRSAGPWPDHRRRHS